MPKSSVKRTVDNKNHGILIEINLLLLTVYRYDKYVVTVFYHINVIIKKERNGKFNRNDKKKNREDYERR